MGHLHAELKIQPGKNKVLWINQIKPWIEISGGRDRLAGGNESFVTGALSLDLIKNGNFVVSYARGKEPWAGRIFEADKFALDGKIQLTNQVFLKGSAFWADSIFYDRVNPFSGKMRGQLIGATLQPTLKLQEVFSYEHVDFVRASTGQEIYNVHLINTKTIYQFDEHFFLRAIIQFDSFKKQVLTDFLASYTLVPGTAVYLGYGALLEKRQWERDAWRSGVGDYLGVRRSLFFKASYLWRL